MLLAVRISSYGCTWEVWRALKKVELLSATPRATLTLLSCPNLPCASITRYMHAKHEPILKLQYSTPCYHFGNFGLLRKLSGGFQSHFDWPLLKFCFGLKIFKPV